MVSTENSVRDPVLPKYISLLSMVMVVVHDESAHHVTAVPGKKFALKFLVTPRQTVCGGTHSSLARAVKNSLRYLE